MLLAVSHTYQVVQGNVILTHSTPKLSSYGFYMMTVLRFNELAIVHRLLTIMAFFRVILFQGYIRGY